jgi:hypothetical protein
MIPRLMHSRISPLPSKVTICNSAKVNGPAFDAIANSRFGVAKYHAVFRLSTNFPFPQWVKQTDIRGTDFRSSRRLSVYRL